jgi:hypothetical protein
VVETEVVDEPSEVQEAETEVEAAPEAEEVEAAEATVGEDEPQPKIVERVKDTAREIAAVAKETASKISERIASRGDDIEDESEADAALSDEPATEVEASEVEDVSEEDHAATEVTAESDEVVEAEVALEEDEAEEPEVVDESVEDHTKGIDLDKVIDRAKEIASATKETVSKIAERIGNRGDDEEEAAADEETTDVETVSDETVETEAEE